MIQDSTIFPGPHFAPQGRTPENTDAPPHRPDFAPSAVNNTYCDDLPGACAGGRPRTAPDQAVYYCEDSGVARLLCACSGRCVNEAQTNHIAHCDRPCVNS